MNSTSRTPSTTSISKVSVLDSCGSQGFVEVAADCLRTLQSVDRITDDDDPTPTEA